jgi:hypothetical protein
VLQVYRRITPTCNGAGHVIARSQVKTTRRTSSARAGGGGGGGLFTQGISSSKGLAFAGSRQSDIAFT